MKWLLLLVLLSGPVKTELFFGSCGTYSYIVKMLAQKYREFPANVGR